MGKTILWWEAHRILYNAFMLIVGFFSFTVGYITFPIVYIFIGLSLNLLYTASWAIELILIRPFHSVRATNVYTQVFTILFYSYSTIAVLLYSIYPDLLQWAVDLWMK